jgi:subtilase family serine protease
LDEGFTGAGKTIVIIDAFQSPTIVNDLNVFNQVFGISSMNGLGGSADNRLPTFSIVAPDGLTPFNPANADEVSWAGEITLDVEWAHAIAPGANIVLVLSKSDADSDILSAQKYAVGHRLGDVISQSFGELETCVDPIIAKQTHDVFIEATLKNITLFASSGDDGAALPTCDGTSFVKGVSSPAVDPLVVGVGGTILTAAPVCPTCSTPAGTYEGEVVWNESSFSAATGGGYSTLYNEPFYQLPVVRGGKRGVPDVAYNAAIIGGVLAVWSSSGLGANLAFRFGGTSAGSPQWAALLSIVDEEAGYDVGFINQGLYRIGLERNRHETSFHDITSGNNSDYGITGFNAGPGWDPTTGWGSPNGPYLVNNLLKSVSPFDGLIGIVETGPLANGIVSKAGHQKPH